MPQQNIPPYYFPTTSFSLPYNFLTLSPFTPFTTKRKAPRNAIQHCSIHSLGHEVGIGGVDIVVVVGQRLSLQIVAPIGHDETVAVLAAKVVDQLVATGQTAADVLSLQIVVAEEGAVHVARVQPPQAYLADFGFCE